MSSATILAIEAMTNAQKAEYKTLLESGYEYNHDISVMAGSFAVSKGNIYYIFDLLEGSVEKIEQPPYFEPKDDSNTSPNPIDPGV